MTCPSTETAARWLLNELSEEEAREFEEHYFDCDACSNTVSNLEQTRRALENALPVILTPERRRKLEAAGQLPTVHVTAGERRLIRLGSETPMGIWVLHANLERAERVDIAVFAQDGAPVFSLRDVPFDRKAGEVVLACRTHYRYLSPGTEIQAELSASSADGELSLGRYVLDHEFDARS